MRVGPMIEASCTNSALSPKSALLSATTQTLNPIVPAAGTDERDEVRIVRCRAARQRLPPSAGAQAGRLRVGIDRRISREHRAEPGVGRSIRDACMSQCPGLPPRHALGHQILTPTVEQQNGHGVDAMAVPFWRKRRGSVTQVPYEDLILPPDAIRMGVWTLLAERYCMPRRGKLTVGQQEAARLAIAGGRSLRDAAADFEVSHETVRSVVKHQLHAGQV